MRAGAPAASAMCTLPVRLALSTSSLTRRTEPATSVGQARQAQLGRHADRETGERLLGHVRLEIDGAVLDDAEQRVAGAGNRRAEPRRAAADDARDGRLDLAFGRAHQ